MKHSLPTGRPVSVFLRTASTNASSSGSRSQADQSAIRSPKPHGSLSNGSFRTPQWPAALDHGYQADTSTGVKRKHG